ncbi:unnamed protein product [Closterium sp. NIES-65]|nr:unnamed protein product [Closterium sp. NIES-65]
MGVLDRTKKGDQNKGGKTVEMGETGAWQAGGFGIDPDELSRMSHPGDFAKLQSLGGKLVSDTPSRHASHAATYPPSSIPTLHPPELRFPSNLPLSKHPHFSLTSPGRLAAGGSAEGHQRHGGGHCSIHELEDSPLFSPIPHPSTNLSTPLQPPGLPWQLGGVAERLQVDPRRGISGTDEDIARRQLHFGANTYPEKPGKTFWYLVWEAIQDKLYFVWEAMQDTLVQILFVCAIASIAVSIPAEGSLEGLYDGLGIFIALFLIITVAAISNYRQALQFQKLNREKQKIQIEVTRSGRRCKVWIDDLVVGDIIHLSTGDHVPTDGVVMEGHSLAVNESSITGESENMHKDEANPFILAGCTIMDGFGEMMVTAVGMRTEWGKVLATITEDSDEPTPLQVRLTKVAELLGIMGIAVGVLIFLILSIRYLVTDADFSNFTADDVSVLLSYFTIAITVLVIAVPEGLPLAVTLTLAFSVTKMMEDNSLVRHLQSCETMGCATTICSDKTGTLTLNEMTVVQAWVAGDFHKPHTVRTGVSTPVAQLLYQAIAVNTSGSVDEPPVPSLLFTSRSSSPFPPPRLSLLLAFPSSSPFPPPRLSLLLAFPSSSPFPPPRLSLLLAFPSSSPFPPPRLSLLLAFPSSSPFPPPRLSLLLAFPSSSPRSLSHISPPRPFLLNLSHPSIPSCHAAILAALPTSSLTAPLLPHLNPSPLIEQGMPPVISGSPTEKAILAWGVSFGMRFHETKEQCEVVAVQPFSSTRKRMGVLIRTSSSPSTDSLTASPTTATTGSTSSTGTAGSTTPGSLRVHWKGAAEVVLQHCGHYVNSLGSIVPLTEPKRMELERALGDMGKEALRTLGFAFRDFDKRTGVEGMPKREDGSVGVPEDDLVYVGFVGIKDPCRVEVPDSVQHCQNAGIVVRMVTGDSVETATAIATECGILTAGGTVMDGTQFRAIHENDLPATVDRLQVLARASPTDKLQLVRALKEMGHVVAVTGDGTNDAPALHEADIGLAMGQCGTEVAKESADIIILDDNFASIVRTVMWGRSVFANIQRFLQFQITVNCVALTLNFISAVVTGDAPLTAVQMLWVDLIQDTLGALALATEPPSDKLLEQPPVGRSQELVSAAMWRNIIGQTVYQLSLLCVLWFKGMDLLQLPGPPGVPRVIAKGGEEISEGEKQLVTIIFSSFVFMQIFNQLNSRKLEEWNVFEGLLVNRLFILIVSIELSVQVLLVELLGKFAGCVRLTLLQWALCFALGAGCVPFGMLSKLIPLPGMLHTGDWDAVAAIAAAHPCVIPSFGLHPWYVHCRSAQWLQHLEERLSAHPHAAMGEAGLHRSRKASSGSSGSRGAAMEEQVEVMCAQLQLARRLHRPIALHCVQAYGNMLTALQQVRHCSKSGTAARVALQQEWRCSKSGAAARVALQQEWRCSKSGAAARVALQQEWRCSKSGTAARVALQQEWRCSKSGAAARVVLQQEWRCSTCGVIETLCPIALHFVQAYGYLREALQQHGPFPAGVILHSFNGPSEMISALVSLNTFFSFSRLSASSPPHKLSHLLHQVCEMVASSMGRSKDEVAEAAFANAVRLFSYPGSRATVDRLD